MLNVIQTNKEHWDQLLKNSAEASVFQTSAYMESYGLNVFYYLCLKGAEILGGISVPERSSSSDTPYLAYDGIVFFGDISKQKSKVENQYQVAETLAAYLFDNHQNIEINNSWDVKDMRPFQWLNYGKTSILGGWNIDVRYTSLLSKSPGDLTAQYSTGRRQSLKKSDKNQVITRIEDDYTILEHLHDLTFNRQGITKSDKEQDSLRAIVSNVAKAGLGSMYVSRYQGIPVNACFVASSFGKAHYIFGASDPEYRNLDSGTSNLHSAISDSFQNAEIFDMVGINSPTRGSFKLGFGGTVQPYFTLKRFKGTDQETSHV